MAQSITPGCLISCPKYRDALLVVSVRHWKVRSPWAENLLGFTDMLTALCIDRTGVREVRLPRDGGTYRAFPIEEGS